MRLIYIPQTIDEWVMSHEWLHHVTYEGVMSHIWLAKQRQNSVRLTHIYMYIYTKNDTSMSRVTWMNASYHVWMSHVPHMNDSCPTYYLPDSAWTQWDFKSKTDRWMSHVTCMDESCHTYESVMSRIWMSHVTHMNESCHIWISHVTHMNESCHIWTSHVTHMTFQTAPGLSETSKNNRWMSHFTRMNASCHIWMSHVPHMNIHVPHMSCQTATGLSQTSKTIDEWVMSHIWMSHVTRMDHSCHAYEWVMSHIWISHVTYERVMSHIWLAKQRLDSVRLQKTQKNEQDTASRTVSAYKCVMSHT